MYREMLMPFCRNVKNIRACIYILIFIVVCNTALFAQTCIKGIVLDADTDEPLIGANIEVKGTSLGAATDFDGKFIIRNVSPGTKELIARYIGYFSDTVTVNVTKCTISNIVIRLMSDTSVVGKEIFLDCLPPYGQLRAIFAQLSSNKITTNKSAEWMQEFSGDNIAEAAGRLTGVSLYKDAGEGYAIGIRGLLPKYSNVTIEGVPVYSTNYTDRSVDLSLLGIDILHRADISKSLTPDMDADALGGNVNLLLKSESLMPYKANYRIKAEGAYNNLRDSYSNYRISGNAADKFFNRSLELLAFGSYELKQMPSDQLNVEYSSPVSINIQTREFTAATQIARLTESNIERRRFNLALILDYSSDWLNMKFFNLYNQQNDSNITRDYTSRFNRNELLSQVSLSETMTSRQMHSIQALFKLAGTELPVSVSYMKNIWNNPEGQQFDFVQLGSYIQPYERYFADPYALINQQGIQDAELARLNRLYRTNTKLTDESYDVKIGWKVPFKLSESFSGLLSAGGKYHDAHRRNDKDIVYYNISSEDSRNRRTKLINTISFLKGIDPESEVISAKYFVDRSYNRGSILGYPVGSGYDIYKLSNMMNTIYPAWESDFYQDGPNSYNQDYDDNEKTYAGYIMGEFNFGDEVFNKYLSIVPGVRFQEERINISGYHIYMNSSNHNGLQETPGLTEVNKAFPGWYPSINIKYDASDYFQVRASAYKSKSLPDYTQIFPMVQVQEYLFFTAGNPLLKPAAAWNFDLRTSFFSNEIGLFSIDLFYKEISDLIYSVEGFYPFSNYPVNNAPADLYDRLPSKSYFNNSWINNNPGLESVNGYIPMNNPETAYLRGIEIGWQNSLWFLPGVLSGVILDVNLTLMNSGVQYPYFELKGRNINNSPGYLAYGTTQGSLPGQPSVIYNAIIGWDYEGFSARTAVQYQKKSLKSMEAPYGLSKSYFADVFFIDISLSQQVMSDLSVFAHAANINNYSESSYYSHPGFSNPSSIMSIKYPAGKLPETKVSYGWTIQLGLSYGY